MLNDLTFVQDSLNTNLFFLRTIRQYCLNIQLAFYKNNQVYVQQADDLRKRCEELGSQIVGYTGGYVPIEALEYQLFLTDYTLEIELLTEKLFNVDINTEITRNEMEFQSDTPQEITSEVVEAIYQINKEIKRIIQEFINLATEISSKMRENNLFSYSYISFYQYMISVTNLYMENLERLNNYEQADPVFTISNRYQFNESMYQILQFTRGFLDPEFKNYIVQLDLLIDSYEPLLEDYRNLPLTPANQKALTKRSIEIVSAMKTLFSNLLTDLLAANIYFIVAPITIENFYTDINYFYYTLIVENEYLESIS